MTATRALFAAALAFAVAMGPACAAPYPADPVAAALKAAGKNRAEMQRILTHYAADAQKLEAARSLLSSMIGKAYKVVTQVDARGRKVDFDCLRYPNLEAAMQAYEALEKKHGALSDRPTPTFDLATLKADFLIDHIDRAFAAWKTLPWAREVSWETFRDYVLPYRAGKEPAEAWRGELMARYADLPGKMKDPADLREAAGLISGDLGGWVGFWDLYYMHPTEQGFSEMKLSRKGRCGDLSNLAMFALRANGIPCATDYTPYWADAGNNHAWPVTLDARGRGHDSVGKAAKIYRKTFANHAENLCYHAADGERIPPWLDRPDYVDVTAQYLPTTDVALALSGPQSGAAHAYLCVFNDGEWRPIQWGAAERGRVAFAAMGRNIAYLPATFGKAGVQAAGPPFILTPEGQVRPLPASAALPSALTVAATSRGPEGYRLATGKAYELFVYQDGWRSLGKQTAEGRPLTFADAPSGGLYWLVEEGSRREERIFTVEGGKQVWW